MYDPAISKYLLGMDDPSEDHVLMEARKGKNAKEVNDRLCEAFYYIGEQRLYDGDRDGAREFFQKSIETKSVHFIEYHFSKVMLIQMSEGQF